MIRADISTPVRALCAALVPPAGGACPKGQGRGYVFAVVAAVIAGATGAEAYDVPSGQVISLNEILLDEAPGDLWVRFRFHAPQIGRNAGDIGYDASAPDMDHLCDKVALPYLAEQDLTPERVVISLANQMIAFGSSDPTVTQFFEAYRPENARCIWEEF